MKKIYFKKKKNLFIRQLLGEVEIYEGQGNMSSLQESSMVNSADRAFSSQLF